MSQSTLPSELKTYSVLPDNKSALERALELSLANELFLIESPFPDLLNAKQSPVSALPSLAVERQVSDWSSTDSDADKRATIDNQWQVFSLSGTVAGIRLALEGMGGETEITRWYEYGGEPYHMRLRTWITAAPDEDMLSRLSLRIDEAKSLRDEFSIGVGVKQKGKIHIGGVIQMAPRFIVGPWAPPIIQSSGKIYAGGYFVCAFKVKVK